MRAKRAYLHHGHEALKAALDRVAEGEDWTLKLGTVGAALRTLRAELLESIGGAESASPQQQMLVSLIVRTHLLIESADRFILAMPSPVNRQKRTLFPVIEQRQRLVDSMARLLGQLGLDRKRRPAPSLSVILAQHDPAQA